VGIYVDPKKKETGFGDSYQRARQNAKDKAKLKTTNPAGVSDPENSIPMIVIGGFSCGVSISSEIRCLLELVAIHSVNTR
jgi:hypothetical protein